MVSLEDYVKQNIRLAKSLVIKSIDTAIAINKGLFSQTQQITPSDKKQWKYFLNIAGIKHPTNADVQVTVIEKGSKESLTKDLLNQYRYTKNELLLNGSLYDELISLYPNEIMYIHGCMYPCDIDKAINAEEGTILAYNTTLVGEQEYTLIRDIETYIKNYLARWNVSEYSIVDELFIPGVLATLYASLPNKIINLRLDNILTNQVDDFHLEHFFRSHLDTWDEVSILQRSTLFWLYKNLPVIIKNIGKEQTLKTVIERILNPNMIGLGEYLLRIPNISLSKDPGITEPVYTRPELVSSSSPRNTYFSSDGEQVIDIDTLVNKEIQALNNNNSNSEKNEVLIEQVKRDISSTFTDQQKTKLLEITTYQLYKRNGVDLFKLLLDHLIYKTKNGTLSYLEEYVEPNTNRVYMVDSKTAILMIIKIIMKLTGAKDIKLTKVYYDTVINPDPNRIDEAKKALFPDGYLNRLLPEIKNNYPTINRGCFTANEFKTLIENINTYFNFLWTLDANSESGYVSANLKMLYNFISERGEYFLTTKPEGEYIDNLLIEAGVDYNVESTWDLEKSYQAMMLAFTGITIDEYAIIRETSQGFKSLLQKLTSYTVQIFMTDSGEDTIFVRYNNTGIMRAYTGIINLNTSEFYPIETNKLRITGKSYMFIDSSQVISGSNINMFATMSNINPVNINGYSEEDKDMYWLRPNIQVELSDPLPYDLTTRI